MREQRLVRVKNDILACDTVGGSLQGVDMKKIYVLDTNVLLYDSQALEKFEENSIIIPITVIEEIDRFKKDMNETGRNARQVSRLLDALRKEGSLIKGVQLESGGTLRVEICEEKVLKMLNRSCARSA